MSMPTDAMAAALAEPKVMSYREAVNAAIDDALSEDPSVIFLGERLRGWQLFGFALVMSGILLVTWRSKRRSLDAEQVRLGVMYGAGAMFLMAVGVVMVKDILETHLSKRLGHGLGIVHRTGSRRRQEIVFNADNDRPGFVVEPFGFSQLGMGRIHSARAGHPQPGEHKHNRA